MPNYINPTGNQVGYITLTGNPKILDANEMYYCGDCYALIFKSNTWLHDQWHSTFEYIHQNVSDDIASLNMRIIALEKKIHPLDQISGISGVAVGI